eukprot:CAMPEP_0196655360 /NCGR_PEP_ID=MMETSP1086-20130531/5119_1 /TAXON_ID=77921 /ORGANISM="Cyanoptyche  gloeocystis , Strain SAG4.97" /LENGTH=61 /DNA_ID=CAMNT_0041987629 /DNA_START=128 /DNA_END=310 /DNA_ORIENTATION=+
MIDHVLHDVGSSRRQPWPRDDDSPVGVGTREGRMDRHPWEARQVLVHGRQERPLQVPRERL